MKMMLYCSEFTAKQRPVSHFFVSFFSFVALLAALLIITAPSWAPHTRHIQITSEQAVLRHLLDSRFQAVDLNRRFRSLQTLKVAFG